MKESTLVKLALCTSILGLFFLMLLCGRYAQQFEEMTVVSTPDDLVVFSGEVIEKRTGGVIVETTSRVLVFTDANISGDVQVRGRLLRAGQQSLVQAEQIASDSHSSS